MQRNLLSNLKTRAQAAFRFTYFDTFDVATESNETAARDCSTVCVCNVKDAEATAGAQALAVALAAPCPWDVWAGDCRCDYCRARLSP